MKIHLTTSASIVNGKDPLSLLAQENHCSSLMSFAYSNTYERWCKAWDQLNSKNRLPNIVIDSGAFTAWSAGQKVDIDRYTEFALTVKKQWKHKSRTLRFVNLDSIPGKRGVSATPMEIQESSSISLRNAQILRSNGVTPLVEVFHQDEPFDLLKTLNDRRGEGLIAISPRNDVSLKKRESWLMRVSNYCVKYFGRKGIPPSHGLGVTSEKLLRAFPFYSSDSSTWIRPMVFGGKISRNYMLPPLSNSPDANFHSLRMQIRKYMKMEYDMTNLWEKRGIIWDEQNIR